ncbi:serine/arginine repetitive matrix protein 1-like [Trachypithecus francoisi]|uniref:serine/arginine repetitive matrix protein 1-like n=1 Tax=Trachypithecus francoisi TaxID=54180 RepID=UPI00141AF2B2|nr:serine/arginine repetitive matrix protein 1-like [Trachypithecus francoisi]
MGRGQTSPGGEGKRGKEKLGNREVPNSAEAPLAGGRVGLPPRRTCLGCRLPAPTCTRLASGKLSSSASPPAPRPSPSGRRPRARPGQRPPPRRLPLSPADPRRPRRPGSSSRRRFRCCCCRPSPPSPLPPRSWGSWRPLRRPRRERRRPRCRGRAGWRRWRRRLQERGQVRALLAGAANGSPFPQHPSAAAPHRGIVGNSAHSPAPANQRPPLPASRALPRRPAPSSPAGPFLNPERNPKLNLNSAQRRRAAAEGEREEERLSPRAGEARARTASIRKERVRGTRVAAPCVLHGEARTRTGGRPPWS